MNPKIRIHNTHTGEIVDREMTDEEFEQYEIDQENYAARQVKIEESKQAADAAKAKLAALGLDLDDLKALGF